jgi:hypothetical protein
MQKVVLSSEPVVVRSGTPNRAGGTPSKLRPSSTEKRSSSLSKSFGKDAGLRTQTPTERRSSSSRRVRRWENANLFGLEIHQNLIDDCAESAYSDGKPMRSKYSAFNAESKTQFQAMLEANDQQLLDRFRKCEEDLSGSNRPKFQKPSKYDSTEGMSPSEKYDLFIERGLLSVERRARQVLMHQVSSNLSLIEFTFELEQALFNFIGSPELSPQPSSSSSFINTQYWSNPLHSKEQPDPDTMLLRFESKTQNAAFFRLLVHGICQFHGLPSKSLVDSKVLPGSKYMQIKKSKSVPRSIQHRISLGAFLFAMLLNRLRDSEVSPIRVPIYHVWEFDIALFRSALADVRAKLMISPETSSPIGNSAIDEGAYEDDICADFVMVDMNDFGVVEM